MIEIKQDSEEIWHLYYNGEIQYNLGLVFWDGFYYYVKSNGALVCNEYYHIMNTNGLMETGEYEFNKQCQMVRASDYVVVERKSLERIANKIRSVHGVEENLQFPIGFIRAIKKITSEDISVDQEGERFIITDPNGDQKIYDIDLAEVLAANEIGNAEDNLF